MSKTLAELIDLLPGVERMSDSPDDRIITVLVLAIGVLTRDDPATSQTVMTEFIAWTRAKGFSV